MKKSTKIWLITASILFVTGACIFMGVLFKVNFDFKKLDTGKYSSKVYNFSNEINDIDIDSKTTDVEILLSEDEGAKVVCFQEEKMTYNVSVVDKKLVITQNDIRKWYDHIKFFSFHTPKIKVYLPRQNYKAFALKVTTGDVKVTEGLAFDDIQIISTTGDIKCDASVLNSLIVKTTTGDAAIANAGGKNIDVKVTTGDVKLKNIKTENIKLSATTGDTKLENIFCYNISATADTGDTKLSRVMANKKLYIKRTTGDVKLEASDSGEIEIITDTGDVKGSLLSSKIFVTKTDTGDVNVPQSYEGGKCKITTDTGDIKIVINKIK